MNDNIRDEADANKRMLEQMRREKEEYEQKLAEQQEAFNKEKMQRDRLKVDCHFKNINEDPMLSGTVKKIMFDGQNNVGKKDPYNQVELEIGGMGVSSKHGMFKYNEGERTGMLYPNHEDCKKFKSFVNGKLVT